MRVAVTDAEVPDEDVKFCLVLPHEPVSVPVMRRVLGGTLLSFGADAESVADLLLAATEACTNVLRHGERAEEYEVYASVGHDDCLLEIANGTTTEGGHHCGNGHVSKRPAGQAGNPAGRAGNGVRQQVGRAARKPADARAGQQAGDARQAASGTSAEPLAAGRDVARVPESGRGLAIMRACVDDLTLRGSAERGTVVYMRKRMGWGDGTPGHDPAPINGHGTARHDRPGAAA